MTSIAFWALLIQVAGSTVAASAGDKSVANGFTVTLDIAAVLAAVLWPMIIMIILLAYRHKIPSLVQSVLSRITKLEVAGLSLELAKATAFVPNWSETAGALDLRQKAMAVQVNDSTAMTFSKQLMEGGAADYAEINLGTGEEWLTSRLFIMAIVFARVKEIQCFVFVETSGNVRRRYVGWAEPERIRWALAKRYAWLEQAYAEAYSATLTGQRAFIVNHQGKLGYQFSSQDPGPSIELVREFLQRVQAPLLPPAAMPSDEQHWVQIDSATGTREHTSWINGEELEEVLGTDLNQSSVRSSELRSKNESEQLRTLLAEPVRFVPVVTDDQRFEYLVDRNILLEQIAKRVSSGSDGRD